MSESSKLFSEAAPRFPTKDTSNVATHKALSFIFGLMFLIQCLSGDFLTILVAFVPGLMLMGYGLKPMKKSSSNRIRI